MACVVLVVEDNDDVGTAMEIFLQRAGAEVLRGSRLEQAQALFIERKSDIRGILMDACLESQNTPDTYELVRSIRRAGFLGPIVAMSGREDYRMNLVAAGCSHEMPKEKAAQFLVQLLGI